jgi:hypothetical protein
MSKQFVQVPFSLALRSDKFLSVANMEAKYNRVVATSLGILLAWAPEAGKLILFVAVYQNAETE